MYDDIGQLTFENGVSYTYDTAGNILSKTYSDGTVIPYTYRTSGWTDQLISYNGQSITYGSNGNPLTWRDGLGFSWSNGTQLASVTQNSAALASYTYDAFGTRATKTVGGTTTTYHYLDGALQLQTDGTNRLYFYYDADGTRLAVKHNGYLYHYYYNIQGDVIGLYDKYGNVVAQYTYDAWGNPLSVTDYNGTDLSGQPTHIANLNPFRYRGYYYDTETGFYYLNSRYYDPEVCRFISPDVLLDAGHVIGYNMYAYCGNNPVIRADDSGHFWDTVFDVVSLCLSVVDVVKNYDDPWAWAGLVGDVVDIIPFVTCAGEAIKGVGGIVRTTNYVNTFVDTADTLYDTTKAFDNAGKIVRKKGWQLGDDITTLTRAGNYPSWSTVRKRYWKNEAYFNKTLYSDSDISRMQRGAAPLYPDLGVPKELHHINGRDIPNPHNASNLDPVWPWVHDAIDPHRHYTGPRP